MRLTAVARGGGGGAVPPPILRYQPPAATELVEDHDLVWDDGVAPEPCLDFDAPHVSSLEGLMWWLGGLGFFFSVFQYLKSTNPPAKNPVHPRTLLTDNFGGALDDKDDDE